MTSTTVDLTADIEAAAAQVAPALVRSGYAADLTPASLWEIDRFFDEQATGGEPRRRGLLADDLGRRLFAISAYVGEVLRREFGGTYSCDTDGAEARFELHAHDGTVTSPSDRVLERLRRGEEASLAAHAAALGLDVGPRPAPRRRGLLRRG